jgi:O-antigen/teichoic acid export membrane protein
MVFLKWFSKDISQISFFSVAFNLAEKGLLIPQTVGSAIGASLMAQYGRDRLRLPQMVSAALRFLMLFALPIMFGLAALSPAIVPAVYGRQYLPAILPLAIAAVLAVPKALILPAQQSLQATENQGFLIWWGILCGVLNVVLDIVLIPHWQATGAAVANGAAQTVAAIGTWIRVWQLLHPPVDTKRIGKLAVSAIAMAGVVLWMALSFRPWPALIAGVPLGGAVFLLLLRLTSSLDAADRERFALVRRILPTPVMKRGLDQLLGLVVPVAASPQGGVRN